MHCNYQKIPREDETLARLDGQGLTEQLQSGDVSNIRYELKKRTLRTSITIT